MSRPTRIRPAWALLLGLLAAWPAPASAQDAPAEPKAEEKKDDAKPKAEPAPAPLPDAWRSELKWRPIGPANMGGRIVALSVFEADPNLWWAATASGGLLRTENNGITFAHQFDREATVSIGDVCVAPSDKNIVWVGTGENNPRNSVSYGDGVYKSTDGGKTWQNMGLKGTFQIGRVVVHPKDPNAVYVGALGRLYGPNPERGLFKTTDGGVNWEQILYIDNKTGIIDFAMKPDDPETLIVATYERGRDLYDANDPSKKWGPGGGIYKTTDGGKTFKKLTNGLPTCQIGRVGLDFYRKDPNTLFAIVETEKIGMGPPPKKPGAGQGYMGVVGETKEDKVELSEVVGDGPAAKAGLKAGDVVVKVEGQALRTYEGLLGQLRDKAPDDKVKLEIERAGKTQEVEVTLGKRPAPRGGQGNEPDRPFGAMLGGQRENAQEQQGPDGFQYGGIYKSTDAGETWARINSLNPRPMYFSQVRVDPSDDQNLYVLGIGLYRSKDGGKTFRADGGRGVHADQHALWVDPRDGRHILLGCDGGIYFTNDRMENWDHLNHAAIGQFYHVAIDTRRDYKAYGGLQDNGSWGGPTMTHSQSGPVNEDWVGVGGGDGFKCQVDPDDPDQVYFTSQGGAMGRRHLKTGEASSIRPRAPQGKKLRWNWNTPFILSRHNPKIFYCAGNFLFRSLDRGNDLRAISPELPRTEQGTATALAESPRNPDVLYVGTDDGNLWVTRDGGKEWTNVVANVGLPKPCYVATIEASRFADGRAYVAFDGHRSDIDDPLVYVTEDYGKTWKSIRADLPRGSSRCLREDIKNADLLLLGTEFGAWASVDRGHSWRSLNSNLPTVAVHEFAIHPTAGEVVAATHGRSLWVLEMSPLRQATRDALAADAALFRPVSAVRWRTEPARGRTNRRFVGENPPRGAQLDYALAKKADKVTVKVLDHNGEVVRELRGSTGPGLHRLTWDLNRSTLRRRGQPAPTPTPAPRPQSAANESESEGEGDEPGGPGEVRIAFGRPRPAPPGLYRVLLTVDGKDYAQSLRIEPDPTLPQSALGLDAEEELEQGEDDDAMFEDDGEESVEEELERSRPID